MSKPFVAILMGSDSDLPVMQTTLDVLKKLEVPFEVKITSAHRTPQRTHEYVKDADQRGCAVFIGAAGLAAHLAGTVAGLTVKPVIGVPMDAGPGGIPVASVAIGKAGAKNAAYLAAQMMALSDESLAKRLLQDREDNAKAIAEKDAELQKSL